MTKTVFFSVGEPSGDQHAARLIRELEASSSGIQTRGFGGPTMRQAGCQLDRDLTKHAVVGLIEVLPKLRDFFRFADQADDVFASGEVDAVVLVDFPGFNWHIAKRAKRHRIPVFYYCPPQLWAWGGWRVKKMRRSIDHVLAVLPIEEEYFTRHQIPSTYVGHPFFDAVADQSLDHKLMRRFEHYQHAGQPLVAVLPGSRTHEVQRNWPIMLRAIRQLHERHPNARFMVAAYRDSQCVWCHDQLCRDDKSLPMEFFVGRTSEVIEAARCAMMVSGSVSLELMARRTPAAVIYRVGRLMHAIARRVVGVDSITLPNLMSERRVFPEMVSVGKDQPAVEFLTASIDAMLADEFYYRQTVEQLDDLRQKYAFAGASRLAAQWLIRRLDADVSADRIRRAA